MGKQTLNKDTAKTLLILVLLALLTACQGKPASPAIPANAEPTASLANVPFPFVEDGRKTALSSAQNEWFATAATCTPCHQSIQTSAGSEFSPAERWRGTIMANSARDPYFRASLGFELENSPPICNRNPRKMCHLPYPHGAL